MSLTTRILSLLIVGTLTGCVTQPVTTPTKIYASKPAVSQWSLDNAGSSLSFVSVKAGDVGEVHKFNELSGTLDKSGQLSITVQLASVDTSIPIRDERMGELLFRIDRFPTARVTAQVDMLALQRATVGDITVFDTDVVVFLNGTETNLTANVTLARLSHSRLIVSSNKPVIIHADAADLGAGLEKLREIAGLPSISKAVPVTFVLSFVGE